MACPEYSNVFSVHSNFQHELNQKMSMFKIKSVFLVLAVSLSLTGQSFAQCIGSDYLSSCNDNRGNSYTVQRIGNSTYMNGSNARTGSNWSQQSQQIGNSTYTTGRASDGNTWNSTTTNYGNGHYSISGSDASGNSFNKYCTSMGCY